MLTFKQKSDRDTWRRGEGSNASRERISLYNAISEAVTGKSAVVTSWYRNDNTWHNPENCEPSVVPCADFRTRIYDDDELKAVLSACIAAGLPAVSLYRGEPHQHIHCGDIMTLAYEVE